MPIFFSKQFTRGSTARAVWLGWMAIGWSCTGCTPAGPARQAISGTITLNGKEATGLSLVFTPTGSQQLGAAVLVVNGRFSLDAATGPSAGQHDVTVDTIEPDLEEFERLRQAGKKPFSSIKLHPRYRKPGALQAIVLADQENIFSFEVHSR